MDKSLLNEFKTYCKIKDNEIEIKDINTLTPSITLPLMYSENIQFKSDTIKEVNPIQDNSIEITNSILTNLNINTESVSSMKFIFYELISNIQDHSQFKKSFVMGKSYGKYFDFGFIDDGLTIPQSFKNHDFEYDNDCDAIIKALNGLSTKNELGYIERGTGLNNTTNIVLNGYGGSVLLISGCGLIYMTPYRIEIEEIEKNCIDGTMICMRMDLSKNVNIYNYLNQIKYSY